LEWLKKEAVLRENISKKSIQKLKRKRGDFIEGNDF
jgi:hypothetical protein